MRISFVPTPARTPLLVAGLVALLTATCCSDAKTIALLGGTPSTRTDAGKADSGSVLTPDCVANADCITPNPFCDTLTKKCVQCLANEDCPALVCNAVTHSCTGCLTNADCGGTTPFCDRDDRRCVECESASQCPPGEVCVWAAHRCAPACQTNSDCAGSGHPICAIASRVCVECTSDAECATMPLQPYCDLRLGACVECLSDANCASSHCETLENLCVECTSDTHCNGRVCDDFVCLG
jgi:hypothetical protein